MVERSVTGCWFLDAGFWILQSSRNHNLAITMESSSAGSSPELTPTTLNIIRLALLAGSAIFGGIAWYLTSSGQMTPSLDEDTASVLRYVFYGLVVAHLLGIFLIRQRADMAEAFAKRAQLLIVGYALAEGLVLFGAVYLFLTGNTILFLGGLLVFLVAFFFLPIQHEAEG